MTGITKKTWFIVIWLVGLPVAFVAGALLTVASYTRGYFREWPAK
jgi:hypothetical protein